MPEKEHHSRNSVKESRTLAEVIASAGCMEGKKALRIMKVLCRRCLEAEEEESEALPALNPQSILLSPSGKISFQHDTAGPAGKLYLPPEYKKGATSRESAAIYSLGMLLLFLVTGQETKSAMDAGISSPVIREAILRCTALDSKRRFQSLPELYNFLTREMRFPRKRLKHLLVILVLLLTAAGAVYAYLNGSALGTAAGESAGYQAGYKDGYDSGVSDAPGIGIEQISTPDEFGNLSGNLNAEHSAFAVYDGENVYFTCGGKLYEMDPYTKKTLFLAEHGQISNLCCRDGRLYYLADGLIMRLDTGSGEEQTVSDTLSGRFCICDGILYLDDEIGAGYLYSIDLDTLESKQLNAETEYHYLNVTEEKLFYADPDQSNYLFRCDHDGGNATRLMSRACRDIDLCGDYLYCLVAEETYGSISADTPGVLARLDTEGGDMEILTNQPVSSFVATESGIFYISEPSGCLQWISADGETVYTVCDGPVSDFNIAGRWIFYTAGSEDTLYRISISGSEAERVQ